MAEQQIGIRIGLQGVQAVSSGLSQVQAGLTGLATQAAGAGAVVARLAPQLGALFSVGAFTQFIRTTAQAIDGMNDLADATGASIEEISKLDVIVRRSGGTFDTAAAALVKFNEVLRNARPGSSQAEALRAIGLEAEALRRQDPAAALRETAQALAGFADNADKARLVQELFGRSVREVGPLLKDLAEAGNVAASVTAEQAQAVDELNKQLARLQANATDASRGLLLELVPTINDLAERSKAAREAFGGFRELLAQGPFVALDLFEDPAKGAADAEAKVKSLTAQIQRLRAAGSGFDRLFAANLEPQLQEAQKLLDFYQRVLTAQGRIGFMDAVPPVAPREIRLPAGGQPAGDESAARRAEAARQAYARLNQTLQQSIRLQEEELALGGSISAARRIQIDGYQKLSEIAGQLNGAQRVTIRNLIEEQAANARLADTNRQAQEDAREQLRITEQLNAERARYLETLASSATTTREAADAAAEELIGLVAGQRALEELRVARLEDAAAEAERKAMILGSGPESDNDAAALYRAEAAELRRLAALRRQIATVNSDNEVKEANQRAGDEIDAAWKRITDDIGQALTDAIIEGGVSGREALERAFKSLVLRPIIQAAVQPIAQQITGSLGLPGIPQTGSQGPSAIGSFLSSNTASAISTTLIAADAFMSAKAGNWGTAIGTAAGQYLGGPIGAVIGKTIGQGIDKLLRGGAGTPSVGSVVTVNASGARTGGPDPSRILDNFNRDTDTALKLLAGQSVGLLNSLALATGGTAQFEALAKFTADNNDPSFGEFFLTRDGRGVGDLGGARKFASDPRAGFEAFATDVAAITRQALADIDLPAFARRQIDALGTDATLDQLTQVGQSIQATITAIGALRTALDPLAGSLGLLADQSSDSLFRLAELSGGFDALGSNVQTFYGAFVSETERAAAETARISDVLGKFGLQIPQTRDEFADLVQAQIALGEAGQPALAALLGVAGSFDQLTTRADTLQRSLSDALIGAAERFAPDQVTRLRTDRIRLDLAEAGVQIDLQSLLGASVDQIRDFAQAFISTGTASTEAQIAVLNAAGALAALRDTGADTSNVLSQRAQFEERILELRGDTAAIRARRLAEVTDAQNRSLLEQIFAMEDAAEASQQFASSVRDVTRTLVGGLEVDTGDFLRARQSITPADLRQFVGLFPRGSADREFLQVNLDAGSGAFTGALANELAARLVGGNALPFVSAGQAVTSPESVVRGVGAPADALDANTEALRKLTGSLSEYLDSLLTTDAIGLSPEAQAINARAAFDQTLQAARGGDQRALERLQSDTQRAIEATRRAEGSGAVGAANLQAIVDAVRSLSGITTRLLQVQEGGVQVTARGLSAVESAARGTTQAVAQSTDAQRLDAQRLVGFDA